MVVSALLFSLFTVFVQVTKLSLAYLQTDQLDRHRVIIEGVARSPYQYRIFSEYIVEWIIRVYTALDVPNSVISGFISFRVVQNLLIFILVSKYYKTLGLDDYVTLIGMSILAWAMTHSLYDSDLAFNTYSDVIFYLAAAVSILNHRYIWVILITVFAALNRETSGLIPLLLISYVWYAHSEKQTLRYAIQIAIVAWTLYAICFVGLRMFFGVRELALGYGHGPGFDYFHYNVTRYITYVQLFATLGVLPFLSLISFPRWPASLKAFFWAIVPIWLLIHPFVGIIAETRYFLVPLALVFIPGALFRFVSCNRSHSNG